MDKILTDKLQNLASVLISEMEIKYPIELFFTDDNQYMGAHYDEYKITRKGKFKPYHRIVISHYYPVTYQDYLDTFAHEMIHAWQSENNLKRNHGKEFNKWVKYILEYYNLWAGKDIAK